MSFAPRGSSLPRGCRRATEVAMQLSSHPTPPILTLARDVQQVVDAAWELGAVLISPPFNYTASEEVLANISATWPTLGDSFLSKSSLVVVSSNRLNPHEIFVVQLTFSRSQISSKAKSDGVTLPSTTGKLFRFRLDPESKQDVWLVFTEVITLLFTLYWMFREAEHVEARMALGQQLPHWVQGVWRSRLWSISLYMNSERVMWWASLLLSFACVVILFITQWAIMTPYHDFDLLDMDR